MPKKQKKTLNKKTKLKSTVNVKINIDNSRKTTCNVMLSLIMSVVGPVLGVSCVSLRDVSGSWSYELGRQDYPHASLRGDRVF